MQSVLGWGGWLRCGSSNEELGEQWIVSGESFLMLAESKLGPAKGPGRHVLCKESRNP